MSEVGEKHARQSDGEDGEDAISGFPLADEGEFSSVRVARTSSQNSDGGGSDASGLEFLGLFQRAQEETLIDLPGCSESLNKSFRTVPRILRNEGEKTFNFPMDAYKDEHDLLSPHKDCVRTMDGVSKGFRMLAIDDPSRMTQPTDGIPWAFVGRSIGGKIPLEILRVMYFAHRLTAHIESTGLQGFVVPTPVLNPEYDTTGKKIVCMLEQRTRDGSTNIVEENDDGDTFSLLGMMQKRARNQVAIEEVQRHPLSVRVGFTCACSTSQSGALEKHIFCFCIITPLNNFLLQRYIDICFLAPPTRGCADFETKNKDFSEMQFVWRLILQNEAFKNMGLPGEVGDPVTEDAAGQVGTDALLNIFTIPLKINTMVRANSPGSSKVEIQGFPSMTFRRDDDMNDYGEYVNAYIQEVCWICCFESPLSPTFCVPVRMAALSFPASPPTPTFCGPDMYETRCRSGRGESACLKRFVNSKK